MIGYRAFKVSVILPLITGPSSYELSFAAFKYFRALRFSPPPGIFCQVEQGVGFKTFTGYMRLGSFQGFWHFAISAVCPGQPAISFGCWPVHHFFLRNLQTAGGIVHFIGFNIEQIFVIHAAVKAITGCGYKCIPYAVYIEHYLSCTCAVAKVIIHNQELYAAAVNTPQFCGHSPHLYRAKRPARQFLSGHGNKCGSVASSSR